MTSLTCESTSLDTVAAQPSSRQHNLVDQLLKVSAQSQTASSQGTAELAENDTGTVMEGRGEEGSEGRKGSS